jgi:hypothetical protein
MSILNSQPFISIYLSTNKMSVPLLLLCPRFNIFFTAIFLEILNYQLHLSYLIAHISAPLFNIIVEYALMFQICIVFGPFYSNATT